MATFQDYSAPIKLSNICHSVWLNVPILQHSML